MSYFVAFNSSSTLELGILSAAADANLLARREGVVYSETVR